MGHDVGRMKRPGKRRLCRLFGKNHLSQAQNLVYATDCFTCVKRLFLFVQATIAGVQGPVEVQVRDNNVDQALRALKKKMQREGLYREMRMRRHYEKPSEKRAREKAEAIRRFRKLQRKRRERDEI